MNAAGRFLFAGLLFLVLCGASASVDPFEESLQSLYDNYTRVVNAITRIPDSIWAARCFGRYRSPQKDLGAVPNTVLPTGSTKCFDDLFHTVVHAKEMWAIQMFDASGKLPPGVLNGAFKWIGKYDECISVWAPKNETLESGGFGGQYCTLDMSTSIKQGINMPISLGICIPDSCNDHELIENLHEILKFIENTTWIKPLNLLRKYVNVDKVRCQPKTREWSGAAIGYLFLLSVCGLLVVLGSLCTIYEYLWVSRNVTNKNGVISDGSLLEREDNVRIQALFKLEGTNSENGVPEVGNGNAIAVGVQKEENNENIKLSSEHYVTIHDQQSHSFITSIMNFLKCFSIFSNGTKVLNTNNTGNQLACLHGIRVLSMTWVILGHTYLFPLELYNNLLDLLKIIDKWPFQIVLRGFVSVDSFFVLSGFLLTWLFLNEADKKGKINWVLFYVHRFWRLTPVYMIVLGFYATISSNIGKGPYAADIGDAVICQRTWWWNLLYINNFTKYNDMCMGWMWYLANDMQFYVISPIFLYALWRKPKIGYGILFAFFSICWISSASVTAVRDLPPLMADLNSANLNTSTFQQKMADVFEYLYIKPYIRIGPYLVGVIVGYLFYKTGNHRNFLTWWQQLLAWACASYLGLSVVFGLYHVEMTYGLGIVYNTFSSTAWGIALGWVIYACLTGHADFINTFLSWNGWIPLSRLTYCAYLIHPIIMHVFTTTFQGTIIVTQAAMVGYFATFLLWTYGISFLVSVAFEAPAMALEKLVLKKKNS